MNSKILYAGIILLSLAIAVFSLQSLQNSTPEVEDRNVSVVAEDLDVPWGIEFLPDGDMLVTERPGNLVLVERENGSLERTYRIQGVEHRGEGGLLGIALHPSFTENRRLYLYMTTQDGDMLENRVVRYRLEENSLTDSEIIIEGLPGAPYHDGGRIEFGPDKKLYITAGDATNPEWAQNTSRYAGKILRLNPDGSIPGDNPFDNAVYSYGHRNPQGLTWIDNQLWATEHGSTGRDELNRIERGENYGWPEIEGNEDQGGMRQPVIHSGSDTWAPAGTASMDNSIYFAGLRGNALYKAEIDGNSVENLSRHLTDYGRLRAVEKGPEEDLYISTSNTDGRGNPGEKDDKILRVDPETLG
ncbi:PQQ-dependent sugar dehydrogenase [Candidatus Nanohalobium constans]|uniref:Glucose/sorbosone dehydrogenase n=1 Tax=Candidatus Nanohalobium constans TaxID=2565781 RepID=A0A5Q0UFL9_9ARCH|nr:PQQ-dependent sugar dehydrogenase [Candidatus Nanohalobium constans]QGA80388.1 glucose/sorbosone dehydrogenase [Candidatus Nanohalobium constans]